MPKRRELSGERFGMLTVLSYKHTANGRAVWLCQCDCGNTSNVTTTNLTSGNTKTCGCTRIGNYKHGHALSSGVSREYSCWHNMRRRCYDTKNKRYPRYGGRGIKVCPQWVYSFDNFYTDMGDCQEGLTLDRLDNNRDYEPSNCRWATRAQQARNTKNTKLNFIAVRVIRWFISNTDYSHQRIAKAYGVDRSLIGRIARNKAWRNV